jgi:hypothetical protein
MLPPGDGQIHSITTYDMSYCIYDIHGGIPLKCSTNIQVTTCAANVRVSCPGEASEWSVFIRPFWKHTHAVSSQLKEDFLCSLGYILLAVLKVRNVCNI